MQRKHFLFVHIMLTSTCYLPMTMACSRSSLSSRCTQSLIT